MKKRILAWLLVGCMVCNLTSVTAFAEETPALESSVEGVGESEAVNDEDDSAEVDSEEAAADDALEKEPEEAAIDDGSGEKPPEEEIQKENEETDSQKDDVSPETSEDAEEAEPDDLESNEEDEEEVPEEENPAGDFVEESSTEEIEPADLESEEWIEVALSEETIEADSDLFDNDTLFAGYLQQQMYAGISGEISVYGNYGETIFSGNELKIYRALKEEIKKVASGDRSSTEFAFSYADLGLQTVWTAAQLGLDTPLSWDDEKIIRSKIEIDYIKIVRALMADCPYELYWFDKSVGYTYTGGAISISDDKVTIASKETKCNLSVSKKYQESGKLYAVNTGYAKDAEKAVATAKSIVASYKNLSDYEKLKAYSDKICELTDYNYEAASNVNNYGDPWQIIWVFDGDPNTKVVCEGYAKAFQYLCDLTDFNKDIRCYTVTGTLDGGNHMWNTVRMEDGRNYLVDVTNSDSGTLGQKGSLFLAAYYSGSWSSGYRFKVGSSRYLNYIYDNNCMEMYGSYILTISSVPYSPNVTDSDVPDSDEPDPDEPDPNEPYNSIARAAISINKPIWGEYYYNGGHWEPTVYLTLNDKKLTQDVDFTVSYENNFYAGTATAVATGMGAYVGTKSVNFEIVKGTPAYTEPTGLTALVGQKLQDVPLPENWKWADPGKSFKSTGTFKFSAVFTPKDTQNYNVVTIGLEVKVSADGGIYIVGLKDSYDYTGAKIIPDVDVMDYDVDGGKLLTPGTDYTIKYKNNIKVGEAKITVTGKGNYSGKDVSARFTIQEVANVKSQDLSDLKGAKIVITSPKAELTYNGEAKYPDFTLTLKKGKPTEYRYIEAKGIYEANGKAIPANVALSNNVNKGTATILLKGAGNTKIKKTFKITAANIAAQINVKVTPGTYSVKGAAPASVTVTYGGEPLKIGTDYTIKYSSNKKATTSAKIVITGKRNYAKNFTMRYSVDKLNLSKIKVSAVTAYAGMKVSKVKATVVDGKGNALKPSQYKLNIYKENDVLPCSPSEILTAGSKIYVEAVAKDTKNLEGVTLREDFSVGSNIAKAKVTDYNGSSITKTYTGYPVTFTDGEELKVTLGGVKLKMGTDYEIVSYSNNTNKGTATTVIKGIGSYSGTKQFKFKIKAKKMQIGRNTDWENIFNSVRGFMSF